MTKLAIDVVLLPSHEMMDKAVEINKELLKKNEKKIVLHKEKCLPHISLCMGVIKEGQLPEIIKVLEGIAKEFSSFQLVAEKLNVDTIPTGKIVSGIQIKSTEQLQKLYQTVMKRLWKYLSYDVKTSMLFNPPEVEEVSLYWIKGYAKNYDAPSRFHPHISIGVGETDKFRFPINFTVSRLALCHLGNYCTCRKILWGTTLK